MKYKQDHTGRFDRRPYFELNYIEELCERTLFEFVKNLADTMQYPISSDTFTKLIERDAEELDLFVNMSDYELDDDADGFTEYSNTRKPSVYINKKLSRYDYLETRLRTTLAHEYGHVLLHAPLFKEDSQCKLLKSTEEWERPLPRTIAQKANSRDWMEWQANYAMGALLMPQSAVHDLATWYTRRYGFPPPFHLRTGHAQDLIKYTCKKFFVSEDAARVRLKQMFLLLES